MYPFNVSLSIIEDLGRNLYTNVSSVLSELIANAYDADATEVKISLRDGYAEISDNGIGMSGEDLKQRYLTVGYKRRISVGGLSPNGRPVMGRKGIGKLAVFAIADTLEITTTQENSQPICLRIDYEDIEKHIKNNSQYNADVIECSEFPYRHGTKLRLKLNKRAESLNDAQLVKGIARRFSAIGSSFRVYINEKEIGPKDKELLSKAEFVWLVGESGLDAETLKGTYKNIKRVFELDLNHENGHAVNGWIASSAEPKDLKEAKNEDSLNKILVFTREKVAHEDLLKHATDARVYTKYLFGELTAEFLDTDSEPDIASSSRQSFREDDPRFQKLVDYLGKYLQIIREDWSNARTDKTLELVQEIEGLKEWSNELSVDDRRRADQLLRKISTLGASKKKTRELIKFAVIAFETFKLQGNLDALELLDVQDIASWGPVFASISTFEAACYFQVTLPRLKAIEKLTGMIEDDVLEKFLQEYIAKELWLLDPTWDPISESPLVEKDMHAVIEKLKDKSSSEESNGRVDIKYSKTSFGKHIVIELKRNSVKTSEGDLLEQGKKYRQAIQSVLKELNRQNEQVEIIFMVGGLKAGDERTAVETTLRGISARIVFYKELIGDTEKSYRQYLESNKKAGGIVKVLSSIESFFEVDEE